MNLNKAIQIATEAHKDQVDKVGKSYIAHAMRVMERCKTEDEKIVAVLHDVVEDTSVTIADLHDHGFSERILEAVDAISKRIDESKPDYIQRVKNNRLATRVKLNDLEDNMDIRRLSEITKDDFDRLNRYLIIYRDLLDHTS